MNSTELAKTNGASSNSLGANMERVIAEGDISMMTPSERVSHYFRRCEVMGIDALARPFDYIKLNGKLTLYANKTCGDLLRKIHNVSVAITYSCVEGDLYVVRAKANTKDGREDEDEGSVSIAGLKGEALSNARMKAISKAKRRVTFSLLGLGMLDSTEVETIPTAKKVSITEDGEIIETNTPEQVAAKLLKYHAQIDDATCVQDLMDIYNDASESALIDGKTLELIKKALGKKRQALESEAA